MIEKMFGVYVGAERCGARTVYSEAKHMIESHRRAATRACLLHVLEEEWEGQKLLSVSHVNSWQSVAAGRASFTAQDIFRDEEEIKKKMTAGEYNPAF